MPAVDGRTQQTYVPSETTWNAASAGDGAVAAGGTVSRSMPATRTSGSASALATSRPAAWLGSVRSSLFQPAHSAGPSCGPDPGMRAL